MRRRLSAMPSRLIIELLLHHAAPVAPHHAARDAHDGGIARNVFHHDGVSADAHVVADRDVAEHLGARPDGDVIAERGVALSALVAGASERDALVEDAIVAHDGRLADDYAHGVVDEEAAAQLGGRMDLDAGEEARCLGEHARESHSQCSGVCIHFA